MIENPILKGFCPDPSIIRVEDDFYIATSTFEWWPGVKIHHSKDLRNWRQIPSPLRRVSQLNMIGNPTSGGIWAPGLSYDNGIFYLVYTDVKTKKGRYYNNHNYLVYTDDIYGEWSEPIYLNSTGFDPSLFHDQDGKKYLVNMKNGFKGILIQEYDHEKKCLVGEAKNIFTGTEAGYTEGPHIYSINGYYYLIVAEGGTGYGHCVTMARSKNIFGPYEVDPGNPMLTSRDDENDYLQKSGHASIVSTKDNEWYMVHLCARPIKGEKVCVLGRETAIQKVYWNEDGWLRLSTNQKKAERFTKAPEIQEHPFSPPIEKDDFDNETLDIRYSSPRIPLGDNADLTARRGYLRLIGQESMNSHHNVSLVATKQSSTYAQAELTVDFDPQYEEQLAGLTYMYDTMNFYVLGKTVDSNGNTIVTLIKSDQGVITDVVEPLAIEPNKTIYMRVIVRDRATQFSYSYDGTNWVNVGEECDNIILSDEHCRGFTGAHFGMYCHDMTGLRLHADFDYFSYKDL